MECCIISLCLHEKFFNFILLVEIRGPFSQILVNDHVSKLVKRQIWDLMLVAIEPVNHLGRHDVVERPVVGGREVLNTLTNHVPIEFLKQANKRKVLRRNSALQFAIVHVSETLVLCWVEPSVVAVESEQDVELILVIKLLQYLCDGVSGQHWVGNSSVNDVHNLLGIGAFVRKSVPKLFVSLIELLQLLIIKESLPVVGPALS